MPFRDLSPDVQKALGAGYETIAESEWNKQQRIGGGVDKFGGSGNVPGGSGPTGPKIRQNNPLDQIKQSDPDYAIEGGRYDWRGLPWIQKLSPRAQERYAPRLMDLWGDAYHAEMELKKALDSGISQREVVKLQGIRDNIWKEINDLYELATSLK